MARIVNNTYGSYYIKTKILKNSFDKDGYVRICLKTKLNKRYFRINRLVAIYFIANPENKPFVNHKKGIKTDNRASELEWVTASENTQHAFDIGLMVACKGEKHGQSKLTKEKVIEIRSKYIPHKYSMATLAKEYSIGYHTVNSLINYRTWKL